MIHSEVVIVGGGLAGLSAAIYLGRAKRQTLLVDSGKSMARWEPHVQNYIGFPCGVSGAQLLERGGRQARYYGVRFRRDVIRTARAKRNVFVLEGEQDSYVCRRLLLATGIFHLPPDIPGITPCLGYSMFFCKDCDGYRIQGKSVAIYGWTNETADYALGMLVYTPCVAIVTDGRPPRWDRKHALWIKEYRLPVWQNAISDVSHRGRQLLALLLDDGTKVEVSALFTTRGDIYLNKLAKCLGAKVDEDGQVLVDADMRTSVQGVSAAGCVTPANCQMIIAAGQGATAAQAINHDLLEEGLANHSLRRFRRQQLRKQKTEPRVSKPS